MVHWICDIQVERHIRPQKLLQKLGIIYVPKEIRWYKQRYFAYLLRMDKNT